MIVSRLALSSPETARAEAVSRGEGLAPRPLGTPRLVGYPKMGTHERCTSEPATTSTFRAGAFPAEPPSGTVRHPRAPGAELLRLRRA